MASLSWANCSGEACPTLAGGGGGVVCEEE